MVIEFVTSPIMAQDWAHISVWLLHRFPLYPDDIYYNETKTLLRCTLDDVNLSYMSDNQCNEKLARMKLADNLV